MDEDIITPVEEGFQNSSLHCLRMEPIFTRRSIESAEPWRKGREEMVGVELCRSIRNQGVRYCEETSLHGFQYLLHQGLCTKIFWVLIIGGAITGSFYTVITNVNNYFDVMKTFISSSVSVYILQQSPLTFINDTTAPLSDVFFPSVAICNLNQVNLGIFLWDLLHFSSILGAAKPTRKGWVELWLKDGRDKISDQLLPWGSQHCKGASRLESNSEICSKETRLDISEHLIVNISFTSIVITSKHFFIAFCRAVLRCFFMSVGGWRAVERLLMLLKRNLQRLTPIMVSVVESFRTWTSTIQKLVTFLRHSIIVWKSKS